MLLESQWHRKDRAVSNLAIVSLCEGREDTFSYMFMSYQSGCWLFHMLKFLAQLSLAQINSLSAHTQSVCSRHFIVSVSGMAPASAKWL